MDYEQFFGLKDTPFRLTPDPDYYFPSDVHKEALQTLLYSIRAQEGFIQITGDPGTGKTLTLRTLLKQLGNEVTTALILNPRLSPEELLKVILEDLGLSPMKMEEKSKEELLRFFRDILLEKAQQGVSTVLIIDEAQNLPNDTLEELRLLSNLETEKKKLLQIILVGQLELEDKLKSEDLKQLDQRITIRYRLKPLSKADTIAYINHRLQIAGDGESARFSPRVLSEVYRVSKGVPRLINIICERALMAAFVDGKNVIEKPHFKKAMDSIVGEKIKRKKEAKKAAPTPPGAMTSVLLALLLVVALVGVGYQLYFGQLPLPLPRTAQQPLATQAQVQAPPATQPQPAVQPPAPPEPRPQPEAAAPAVDEKAAEAAQPETKPEAKPEVKPEEPRSGIVEGAMADAGKPTAAAVPTGDITPKPTAAEEEPDPSIPRPPREAYHVPPDQFFLAVNRDDQKAYLWQGSDPAPMLVKEIPWTEPLPGGLFVLGENINKKRFFFNYPLFFLRTHRLPDDKTWAEITKLASSNILPVLSHSRTSPLPAEQIDQARQVRHILKAWGDAWRNKDLERLMSYYGSVFTTYYENKPTPTVYSNAELKRIKKDLFIRSGPIALTLSDPICILDPSNPETVMAVFRQQYSSKVYSDDGVKALYMALQDDGNGKKEWKIVAKLWVPNM